MRLEEEEGTSGGQRGRAGRTSGRWAVAAGPAGDRKCHLAGAFRSHLDPVSTVASTRCLGAGNRAVKGKGRKTHLPYRGTALTWERIPPCFM